MDKIPEVLKIGGHIFHIKFVEFDDDTIGECDPYKNEIRIQEGLSESSTMTTLIHEVLHAINWCMEEEKLEGLSQQLYTLLVDNDFIK